MICDMNFEFLYVNDNIFLNKRTPPNVFLHESGTSALNFLLWEKNHNVKLK